MLAINYNDYSVGWGLLVEMWFLMCVLMYTSIPMYFPLSLPVSVSSEVIVLFISKEKECLLFASGSSCQTADVVVFSFPGLAF